MPAPLPNNEQARLESLYRYKILDTLPEESFDDFTALASFICQTPTALISLVDKDRQWFKSRVGLKDRQIHRDQAFCAYAILQPNELLVVEDAEIDPCFAGNPLVTSEPYIRFYAGAPLVTPNGYAIGTLCVIDYKPRRLSDQRYAALRKLSKAIVNQLELRRISLA